MNPTAPEQRAYLRAHPWVLWAMVGLVAAGLLQIVGLLVPNTFPRLPSTVELPVWTHVLFTVAWTVSGAMNLLALLRGWPKVEAWGMTILAGVLASWAFLTVYIAGGPAVPGAAFIFCLAIGSYQRSKYLAELGRYQ